jgi:hypothetical protein
VAREAARATVRSASDLIMGVLDLMGAALPPNRPLSSEERGMVRPSLEDCLFKYGGELDPGWALALGLAAVAGMRYAEWRMTQEATKQPARRPGDRTLDVSASRVEVS